MKDPFLQKFAVTNDADAMRNSLRAALQRNKTYTDAATTTERKEFRATWAALLVDAAKKYNQPVTDTDHCRTVAAIAQSLSQSSGHLLAGGRMRFGTSQKAFNLYLKCLWRLHALPPPPHCPIDRIILRAAGLSGSWTQSDSEQEYMGWVRAIRERHINKPTLADWEYDQWNRNA